MYVRDHRYTLSTTKHEPQPTPLLAETWELPSLSRLACTPYYKHSGCKIIQCPRTPLCWTCDLVAGTRINPCVTVLPFASISGTRKHAAFTSWNPDPRVRAPTLCLPIPPLPPSTSHDLYSPNTLYILPGRCHRSVAHTLKFIIPFGSGSSSLSLAVSLLLNSALNHYGMQKEHHAAETSSIHMGSSPPAPKS